MFQVENVKARKRQLACSLIGKPLVALAAPPKERYINSVDTDLLCLGVFQRKSLGAHEGARCGRSP